MPETKIATFYSFAEVEDLVRRRGELMTFCDRHDLKGTILISKEGINATVAGSEFGIHALLKALRRLEPFKDMEAKFSSSSAVPFRRMKVKIKDEIVSLGIKGVEPARLTGPHIPCEKWNEVISDPETLVLDTRNIYETHIGRFEGARIPKIESFRDFPKYVEKHLNPKKHKNIAMYCTGGIRCEKAAAFLLQKGFKRVVQLDGGILNYIEKVPKDKSLWRGDCYVFDGRMAVDENLEPAGYVLCPTCRWPVSEEDRKHSDYEEGVTCKHCKHAAPKATIEASRERKKQMELARERGRKHLK